MRHVTEARDIRLGFQDNAGVTISLDAVASSQMHALRQLWELYAYDFSEVVPRPIGEDGRFDTDPEFARRVTAPCEPLFIRSKGNLAGFVFIGAGSVITGDPRVHDMAQFFVLRGHRRTGVGQAAAALAFARRRGPWEVRVMAANHPARAFWLRAVELATQGSFEERPWAHGLLLTFETRGE